MPLPDEGRLQLALQHEQALRRLARSLARDPGAVDDAIQHALVQEACGHRAPRAPLWPFLVTTLRHYLASWRQRAVRRAQHERSAAGGTTAVAVDELVAREQLRRRVADAVLALAEPYRTTVWLRWFQGMTTADVAAHEGVPVATIRSRLQRAQAQLRQRLDAEFGDRRWALLVAWRWPAMSAVLPAVSGVSLMTKKLLLLGAAVVLLVGPFAVPWLLRGSSPAVGTVSGAVPVSAPLATTAADASAPAPAPRTESPVAPPAGAPALATVQLVHADGRAAAGFDVHWWPAAGRPGWTERVDPAVVRPGWPAGMGPGRWSDPWPDGELRSGPDGRVPVPAGAVPAAVSIRLNDGLAFSIDWSPRATIELPPLECLHLALRGAPAGSRWRGGCFGAWREDGEPVHGYLCENVTTGSGPGVLRWDRIPFAGDAEQALAVVVVAGHPCAIEAEGIGFLVEPPVAYAVAKAAVTFACGERVPQLLVRVVAPDGSDVVCSGQVWSGDSMVQTEALVAGQASLDRRDDRRDSKVQCLLDDGSWLTADVPAADARLDVRVPLSMAQVVPPLRVSVDGGFGAAPEAVWIDVGGTFVRASRPEYGVASDGGGVFLAGRDLLLNCQSAAWRGGLLVTGEGRVARWPRPDSGNEVRAEWLPAAPRTIDLPALSHEFGDLPAFAIVLELEAIRADGTSQWLPLRRYRRLLADDHPQALAPWPDLQLPRSWRVRLTATGGFTDHGQSLLQQRLLP